MKNYSIQITDQLELKETIYAPESLPVTSESAKISESKKSKSKKFKLLVCLLLVVTQVARSGYTVVLKKYAANVNLNPFLILICRSCASVILSYLFAFFLEGKPNFSHVKNHDLFFIFYGPSVSVFMPLFQILAVYMTTGSYTSMLSQLVPLFTYIFAVILHEESFPSFKKFSTLIKPMGVFVSLASTAVCIAVSFKYPPSGIPWYFWLLGTVIAIVGRLIFASFIVTQKKYLFSNINSHLYGKPFTIIFFIEVLTSVVTIPYYSVYLIVNRKIVFTNFHYSAIIPILYSSLLNSSLIKLSTSFCGNHLPPVIVGSSFSLTIVSAYIMLYIFCGEVMHFIFYLATVGIVIGVMITFFGNSLYDYIKARQYKTLS